MAVTEIQQKRDELAYIKDVKELIISDARALYAVHHLTSRKGTFDIMTSYYGGAYQAALIYYPDLSENTCWTTLFEGVRCNNLCSAMKHLWSGVQEQLGSMMAAQRYALNSPHKSTHSTTTATTDTDSNNTETKTASSSMSPEVMRSVEAASVGATHSKEGEKQGRVNEG